MNTSTRVLYYCCAAASVLAFIIYLTLTIYTTLTSQEKEIKLTQNTLEFAAEHMTTLYFLHSPSDSTLKKTIDFKDGWGKEIDLKYMETHAFIYTTAISAGPDGDMETHDDNMQHTYSHPNHRTIFKKLFKEKLFNKEK